MPLLIIFLLGLCIGSFLNVLILRLPVNEKIGMDRSRCPSCRKVLEWFELIPVVSFLLQKTVCRGCKKSISWQYLLVEISTGLLFIVSFYNYVAGTENVWMAFLKAFISVILVLVFMIDLKFGLILDVIIWPAIVLIFLLQLYLGHSYIDLLIGSLIAGGFFGLQYVVSRGRWIGAGDIGLGVCMGVILGWQKTLAALLLAYIGGSIISVFLLTLKKKSLQSAIPFGVFLAPATFVAFFWGDKIINWYIHLLV